MRPIQRLLLYLATSAVGIVWFVGCIVGCIAICIWFLGWYTGMVWIPDAVFPHWDVVGEAEAQNLGKAKLVQRWGDDFYTTLLVHKAPSGETNSYMIDSDDDKIWECESGFDSTSIRFLVDGEYEVVFEGGAVMEVGGGKSYGKPCVDDISQHFSWR